MKGLHDFKGVLCHTARWPDGLDVKGTDLGLLSSRTAILTIVPQFRTGKTVAVLGSGSSGIQLLATIQPDVKQIYHWIRSPTWITAAFAHKFAGPGGTNFKCNTVILSL